MAMPETPDKNKSNSAPQYPTTLTNLPGLEGVPVIISKPMMVKENSSKPSKT